MVADKKQLKAMLVQLHREPDDGQNIEALCEAYLRAGDKQRASIRQIIQQQAHFMARLNPQTGYQPADPEARPLRWLVTLLAQYSLYDQFTDSEAATQHLAQIWQQAEDYGMNPQPYFQKIAQLSSVRAGGARALITSVMEPMVREHYLALDLAQAASAAEPETAAQAPDFAFDDAAQQEQTSAAEADVELFVDEPATDAEAEFFSEDAFAPEADAADVADEADVMIDWAGGDDTAAGIEAEIEAGPSATADDFRAFEDQSGWAGDFAEADDDFDFIGDIGADEQEASDARPQAASQAAPQAAPQANEQPEPEINKDVAAAFDAEWFGTASGATEAERSTGDTIQEQAQAAEGEGDFLDDFGFFDDEDADSEAAPQQVPAEADEPEAEFAALIGQFEGQEASEFDQADASDDGFAWQPEGETDDSAEQATRVQEGQDAAQDDIVGAVDDDFAAFLGDDVTFDDDEPAASATDQALQDSFDDDEFPWQTGAVADFDDAPQAEQSASEDPWDVNAFSFDDANNAEATTADEADAFTFDADPFDAGLDDAASTVDEPEDAFAALLADADFGNDRGDADVAEAAADVDPFDAMLDGFDVGPNDAPTDDSAFAFEVEDDAASDAFSDFDSFDFEDEIASAEADAEPLADEFDAILGDMDFGADDAISLDDFGDLADDLFADDSNATESYTDRMMHEDPSTLTRNQAAQKFFAQGRQLASEGDFGEANRAFTEAIELDPEFEAAYFFRAQLRAQSGAENGAMGDYTQVIRLNPANADAYYERSELYAGREQLDRAIDDLTQAISARPDMAIAYKLRGRIYAAQNAYDEALADYDQALKLNHSDGETYCWRGNVLRERGELEYALSDYDQALQLDDALVEAYYYRGQLERDAGNLETALKDYRTALKLDPQNTTILLEYAELSATAGDAGNAAQLYEQYLRRVKDTPKEQRKAIEKRIKQLRKQG